jgi:AcrR family transcriptional regulator
MPRSQATSQRMRADSQARILAAARKLFAEKGYFNCKVSEIARESDMSQGNIYWYFESKEAVLKAVLAEGFGALEKMTSSVAAFPGSSADKVNHLIDQTLALYREQGEFTVILGFLMSHGGSALLQELGFDMLEIGSRYHGNLIPLFDQARTKGVVVNLESNILIMFYFAFFNGMILTYGKEWLHMPVEITREGVSRLLGFHGELETPKE